MKRFSLFLVCLLATVGMTQAGLPLKSYTLQKTESVSLHVFSDDATTIDYLKNGDTLGIASYDALVFLGDNSLEKKVKQSDNFAPVKSGLRDIGFSFPIENNTFTKFGISGNGFISFGDTALSLGLLDGRLNGNRTGENFWGVYLMTGEPGDKGQNMVYAENNTKRYIVTPALILVGSDTKIQYETINDTLYIGFEKLHVLDNEGNHKLTATYQYAVEAGGTISLLIGNIVPEEEEKYFLRTVFASSNTMLVLNFEEEDLNPWGGTPSIVLGVASSQYSNTKYSMVPPLPCSAINDFSIDWTGKITAAPDMISFEYDFYDTEKATNLLMVLSTSDAALKSKLTDKKTYLDSHKIDNFPVRVAQNGYARNFTDLTPSTTYWLHVFPYNTNCADGPIYGQEIIQPVTTSLTSLGGIAVTSINGDTIDLAVSAGNSKYILGVSNTKIYNYRAQPISGILKDGISHQTGDIIPFRYSENSVEVSADIKILAVNATDTTFRMTGAEAGKDYFFYAWAMNGEGENTRYSFDYVEASGRTTTETPVVLDFAGKEMLDLPAGWSSSVVDGDKNFSITTYSRVWDAPVLACEHFYTESTTGTASAWTVSPWFKGSGNMQAVFNVTFYTHIYSQLEGSSPAFSKSINASDSVVFQIQEKGEEGWHTIGRINSGSTWKAAFNEIISDAFAPANEFRFRIVFYQDAQTASATSDGRYFAIKSLGIEKANSCMYPVDIVVPEDSMGYRSAKIMWTDPGEGWNNSYVVKYREAEADDETGWYTVRVNEPQAVLSGLKTGTDYVAEINTLCSADESSLAKSISFKTARNIVYEEKDFNASLSELGYLSLKGNLGSELRPAADGERNWFVFKDETADGEPSVVMIDKMTNAANSWLVLPVLFAGSDGKVKLTVGMSAWLDDASGAEKERKAATGIDHDTLFIYRSANKTFTAESEIVGKVILDNLTPQYQNLEFEFEVEAASPNVFAFYFRKIADNGNNDNESSLGINLIKFEYTQAEFPEIQNLRFSNVTMSGLTVHWEGEAESYALLYKKRGAEKYDTLYTENTEYTLTGLDAETVYSFCVFGYYGADRTLPGPVSKERSIVTASAPSCGTPTDLVSEYDAEANTATLSWKPGESNNGNTIVYVRMASTQTYDSVVAPESSHVLQNLQTNVVYHWCVRAVCNSTYYSELSDEAEFKTAGVANAALDYARGLVIRVNGRQIVVENASRHFIKTLNVYSATGILLRTYAANTDGNVFIPTDLNQGMVIIEAVGSGAERFAVKAVIM
ncbi:MAG: fibronectin type III domain-containing protein [Bacteroidales bacterium]|nr:fibronectin type III domain-containing protein [Bacteroidales bacterium]